MAPCVESQANFKIKNMYCGAFIDVVICRLDTDEFLGHTGC